MKPYKFIFALLSLLFPVGLQAGIHQTRPINIRTALDSGSVLVNLIPSSAGDSTALFDGDSLNDLAVPQTRKLIVTVVFDRAMELQRSRVYLFNQGTWKLEGAQTTVDLDRRRASYKVLGKSKGVPGGGWSEVTFPATKMRCVRLTIEQTADSTLHVGEWTLEEPADMTGMLITPRPDPLMPGTRMQLQAGSATIKVEAAPTIAIPFDFCVSCSRFVPTTSFQ